LIFCLYEKIKLRMQKRLLKILVNFCTFHQQKKETNSKYFINNRIIKRLLIKSLINY